MTLNGKYVRQEQAIKVIDFVRSYKLSKHVVRITINGKRVGKEEFETSYINDQDVVVFTSLVSGG